MEREKKGKRIAIDARCLNAPGSGFNTYLLGLLEPLRRVEGLEIVYLVDRPPKSFRLRDNEQIVILERYKSMLIWEQYSLALHLQKVKYDFILFPCNFGVPLLFKKTRTKCVLILHDVIPFEMPSYIFRNWRYAIPFYFLTIISVIKSDLIITDSHYSSRSIKRLFHRRAEVFYPPIDFSPIIKVALSEKEIRKKYSINTKKYFIYAGGYDYRKNVADLIKAFKLFSASHPEYSLVMTGRPSTKYLKLINTPSSDKIISVGYVNEDTKNSLIKYASALLNGSSMEGFGLPVTEAFRLGTPVITTVNSSLGEVVGDAGIHITNTDVKSFLKSMSDFSQLKDDVLGYQSDLGNKQLDNLRMYSSSSKLVKLILNSKSTLS